MTPRSCRWILAFLYVTSVACAGPPLVHEGDILDVTLPVPAEKVRTAVVQVLTDGGYDIGWKDEGTLSTGYRKEIDGPWDWLLRRRFGVDRSRVETLVTPVSEQRTRVRMNVLYERKDGIFSGWKASSPIWPQRADNQLRLIKNALQLL